MDLIRTELQIFTLSEIHFEHQKFGIRSEVLVLPSAEGFNQNSFLSSRMAQLEGKLRDVEDSPDDHVKLTPGIHIYSAAPLLCNFFCNCRQWICCSLCVFFSYNFSHILQTNIAIDHQLGIANGLEPPEQDGLTTTAPSATYTLKNHENDVTNRLKQETNRLKQQIFEVQDAGYEEEDYIVVDDEQSGLHYYNSKMRVLL